MRRWLTVTFILGMLAFTWYGVVGETGPIGWLNGMQAVRTGSYSRVLSFFVLFIGVAIAAVGVLWVWFFVRERLLGLPPLQIKPAPLRSPGPAGAWPLSFWPTSLLVLVLLMALAWGGVLGWHAWDWRQRVADAGGDYAPLPLGREQVPTRPADGSHLEVQGRPLWDHALVRHATKNTGNTYEPDVAFVPVVGADWRAGDAVRVVLRLDPSHVFALQHRPEGAGAPLWVRVEGTIPGATLPVFKRGEAPVSDVAVLVALVDPQGGRPVDAHPVFDWNSAGQIGGGLSAFLALLWVTAVVTFQAKARMRRRAGRAARAQA